MIEVMVVLIVMGILISMSAPSFRRAIEQTRADVAGANLRSIWSAQRLYWLEHRTYCTDLSEFVTLGLIDSTVASSTTIYVYAIQSADANVFTATATRTGSTVWSGDFTIDQTGVGRLMEIGVELGRKTRPDIKLGICGEHGGEPASVKFCHRLGLSYVSCSPFRVPIARLAAAQAALEK